MRNTTKSRTLMLGIGLTLSLLTAACGARLTEDQRAGVVTGGGTNSGGGTFSSDGGTVDDFGTPIDDGTEFAGDVGGDTGDVGGGDAGGADPGDGDTTGGGPGGGDATGGGDTGGGETTGGGEAPASSTCSGGGDSDVGVSATEIKVGNISTISGPVPGFGQTGVNAVKAYFNFRNATGGVCGRQLTLVTADDRLDAGVNRSETDKLKGQVFAFVGGTTIVDDGGAGVLKGTNIPDVALAVGDERIKLANNFSTTPIDLPSGKNGAENILKYFKAEYGVTKAALISPNQAVARGRANAYKKDLAAAGIAIAFEQEVPVAETNYSSVATGIKNSEAQLVLTVLEITGMSRLAKALDQVGYDPAVPFYGAQAYGKKFIDQSGSSANGTILGLAYSIFEDAGQVKAIKDFLDWYQRSNPGADLDFFAIEGWVAADMFVTALEQTTEPPSRDAVLAKLKTFTSFDAKGFKAPINPAQKKGAKCFMIAGVVDGSWKRLHPAKGYQC